MNTGDKLGPYEILAPIGAGGMGEVWKARDTRLDRTVAIKVCHDQFSERFEREARAVAALNHSNICTLHDVGPNYLVMEFIDGPTLADRIKAGKIPLSESLVLAGQIAEALEAAHDKGIIHRDLKPANIKLTSDGKVKVLDFGLAKAFASDQTPVDPTNSPTATMSSTRAGVILGTAGYMSPEQARGLAVDKRSDIWSYGCVVYELLSGTPAFPGDTVADLVAAVMTRDVELDKIPEHLRPAIGKCVVRDPRQRWRDIGDVRMALEEATPNKEQPVKSSRLWPAVAAGTLLGVALGAIAMNIRQPAASELPALHVQIALPPGTEFVAAPAGSAISPDGRFIAFAATGGTGLQRLWVRRLDSPTARELAGTDGAQSPFWSPDSRSLGFFAAGRLQRIDLAGGLPLALADAPEARGGAWSPDGTIIFAPNTLGVIHSIAASGGTAAPLTSLSASNGEFNHRWPQFLPDGKRFLFYIRSSTPKLTGIYLGSVDRPREKTLLVESASAGRYCSGLGYLLWARADGLVAQPFDARNGLLTGTARPVPGTEMVSKNFAFAVAEFSVANDGTMVFGTGADLYQITWFDRQGKVLSRVLGPDRYYTAQLSPDGNRVAMGLGDPAGNRDLWVVEFARGIQSRLIRDRIVVSPVWSPGGKELIYSSFGGHMLFSKGAGGAGGERQLLQRSKVLYSNDWSPDGRYLMFEEVADSGSDLWLLPLEGDGKPRPYLSIPGDKSNAKFSPDGKWIAYTSSESGQLNIFVRSYPMAEDHRWQVSSGGGNFPRWSHDGKELFYQTRDGMLMAVPVRPVGQGLQFRSPTPLFRIPLSSGPHSYNYDVSTDGQRILAMPHQSPGSPAALTVIVNWQTALKP